MQTATKGLIITLLVLVNGIAVRNGYTGNDLGYGVLVVSLPLLLAAIFIRNTHHK
jgi:hypothetical protein